MLVTYGEDYWLSHSDHDAAVDVTVAQGGLGVGVEVGSGEAVAAADGDAVPVAQTPRRARYTQRRRNR